MNALLKDPLLRLRPMTDEDVDAVMEVEREAYPFPWSHGIFHDCLRVGYCCWVCTLEERIVGYAVMSVAAGEAHLLNLCVKPARQGQGLGRRLMRRLMNLAREHRADELFLEVRVSNTPALELYHALGFNEIGRRRGYYPLPRGREDAILLARHGKSTLRKNSHYVASRYASFSKYRIPPGY
ncbi:MAG: ribosomal protein S18-alanine N-acetyltransferase, partial [Candidatus Sedimenticola endophacoides]